MPSSPYVRSDSRGSNPLHELLEEERRLQQNKHDDNHKSDSNMMTEPELSVSNDNGTILLYQSIHHSLPVHMATNSYLVHL